MYFFMENVSSHGGGQCQPIFYQKYPMLKNWIETLQTNRRIVNSFRLNIQLQQWMEFRSTEHDFAAFLQ